MSLSVRMPVVGGAYKGRDPTTFLDGLVPENPATRQRWAFRFGVDRDDSFGLLAHMGWDCPGAVQFCAPEDVSEMLARADEFAPMTGTAIAGRLRDLKSDTASWTLPEEHWSLPGQQEKFALTRHDDQWFVALGSAPTTHIFKPGIPHLFHQSLVEHATMRAADAVGVAVARSEYLVFEDQPTIVVERFDRVQAGGTVLRIYQEDFCQATGFGPDRKYEARHGPGVDAFARVLTGHSTDLELDRQALADFVPINYVSGSPDGHAKNLSLSLTPGRTELAPLYDLATGFPYDQGVERTVAVSLGGVRKFGQVRRKQWEQTARRIGLDTEWMLARVAHVAERYPEAFAAALHEIGSDAAEHVLSRAHDRLDTHCGRLLDQLGS
jgi:serine/threonine-protein kinase HipA